MRNDGFREELTAYAKDDPHQLIGQIRRLGSAGPAYEIMNVDEVAGVVVIEIIESDERVTSPLAEVLLDPMAETIP